VRALTIHLKISVCFATILLGTFFTLCWLVGDTTESHYMNLAIFVLGWAVGWLAGTLVAPYDPGETTLFMRLSKAISAFVSGYLVAKIDDLTKAVLAPEFLLQPLNGFRAMMFFSVAIVVTIVVFFARRYSDWHKTSGSLLGTGGKG
jgi:hypothetical protein